jgi:hypothetical protein
MLHVPAKYTDTHTLPTQEYEKRLLAKDHELSNARDRIKILEHNLSTREEELMREQDQAQMRVVQLREQAAQVSRAPRAAALVASSCCPCCILMPPKPKGQRNVLCRRLLCRAA